MHQRSRIATSPTLLQRLKNPADHDAWDWLVRLYAPLLLYWARQAGASRAEAEDLVQDVFVGPSDFGVGG